MRMGTISPLKPHEVVRANADLKCQPTSASKTLRVARIIRLGCNAQNRLETSPVKLSNWRVSWQELFCYNPRPYNVTKGFLENYTVIRGMMETYIHKLTDIVFEVSAPLVFFTSTAAT